MDIKTATKAFGKKFSCGASAEKNAENMMEITIQGDVAQDLGQACHDLYDVWIYFVRSCIDSIGVHVFGGWKDEEKAVLVE